MDPEGREIARLRGMRMVQRQVQKRIVQA